MNGWRRKSRWWNRDRRREDQEIRVWNDKGLKKYNLGYQEKTVSPRLFF